VADREAAEPPLRPGRRSEAGTRRLAFRDAGSGERTFLLIHGIGVSSRYFRRLIPELSRHGRVLAPDLPGFGHSPGPRHPLTIEQLAVLVRRFAHARGVTRCTVIGHSMGTQVAVALALHAPELVESVVLIGPVAEPAARTPLASAARLVRDTLGEPPSANAVVLGDYLRCGPVRYLATLPLMLHYPIVDAVGRLTCPVLVMRGRHDPIAPAAWCAELAAAAPNGRFVEIVGARHLVMWTRPRGVAAHLPRYPGG
jgi:pimeloyl-ACP methyl ester carboxylesterase